MKHPSEAAPSSVANIAYDTGKIVERARIIGIISKIMVIASKGDFNSLAVLSTVLKAISEDPEPSSCSCKGSCRKCKNEE